MAEENEITLDDDAIALEDVEESTTGDVKISGVIPFVMERYQRAEDSRYNDEVEDKIDVEQFAQPPPALDNLDEERTQRHPPPQHN